MTIGKRILEIRKKEKLTQAELGDRLNVTDKAVSKWENDTGEPSIQSLVDISKEFNVSLDYLMTGVKDVKNMSLSEKIAATDNLDLYKENYRSAMELDLYFKEAITNKTLIDYLLEYRSEKVLKYIVEHVIGSYKDVFKEYHEEIVLFALENEWFDILNNEQKVRSGLYLYSLAIKDEKKPDENIRYSPSSFVLSGALADGIAKSEYMTEKSWNFILGYGGPMNWSKGIRVILEKAILVKHKQVNNIIKIIERCNNRIEDLKVKHRVGEAYSVYQFYSDGIYAERSYKFRVDYSYIPVSKQSVMNAIEIKDFSLAKKLNLLTNDKVPAYDLKMYEVNSNDKLSEKDKLRESVYVGELIDIDKLIQTKDFDLYEELIKEPATPYELAMKYLKTKEFKKLYKLAEDYHTPYSGYIKQYILDGKNGDRKSTRLNSSH